MNYNLVVIVREVWDTRDLVGDILDSEGKVKENVLTTRFEPEDLNALEMALQIKDKYGGKVTAISLGQSREVDVLRECLYRDVDEVVLLDDPKFTGLDTLSASRVISQAIKDIGDFDLILTGIDVVEGENAQIGSHIAEQLGIEPFTYVDKLEEIGDGRVICNRSIEGGNETVETALPALLVVGVALLKEDPRAPRSAKARSKLKHRRTKIPALGASDLNIDDSLLINSTTIAKLEAVPQREIESKDVDAEDETALRAMLEELRAAPERLCGESVIPSVKNRTSITSQQSSAATHHSSLITHRSPSIWVYIELNENGITDISLQCLSKGRELADLAGLKLSGVVLGADKGITDFPKSLCSVSEDLIAHGADVVYLADDLRLKDYTTRPYKKVICDLIEQYNPEIFLFPASTQGNDLASVVASNLQTGCVQDCYNIEIEDGLLAQKRLEYDGKVLTNYVTKTDRPQIATLRDGIAAVNDADANRRGEMIPIELTIDESDFAARVLKREVTKKTVNLKEAKVIVAGGAGVGSRENFRLIEQLAEALGGEVGATRASVDAGWTSYERQIGQTGTTVKPDLYIACGISGAVQHRVGMMDAGKIVSINIDPSAPIFRFSHYRIVGDLTEVIPKLIKLCKKQRTTSS
ncbi:MAG: FAD-binding protein [Candidatus Poribacteria bacterium]